VKIQGCFNELINSTFQQLSFCPFITQQHKSAGKLPQQQGTVQWRGV